MIIKNLTERQLVFRDSEDQLYVLPASGELTLADTLLEDEQFARWTRARLRDVVVLSQSFGIDAKEAVGAATTANIALTGLQTIDGVVLSGGERVLVKDQTAQAENGIYVAAAGAWTRATDADSASELAGGGYVFVSGGTVNANSGWIIATAPSVVGVDPLVWVRFSSSLAPGIGLSEAGGTINVNVDGSSLEINADTLRVKPSGLTDAHVATANKDGIAETPSLRTLGTGAQQAAAGNDARFPTPDEKLALVGTSGTPSSGNEYVTDNDPRVPTTDENNALVGTDGTPSATNRYVTDTDPRNSNARTPTTHATAHETGQSDPIVGNLDANARVGVRKNSAGSTFTRRRVNFIEGSNITLTIAEDGVDEEIDVTIEAASSIGGPPSGPAGGVLDGSYPNPGLAATVAGNGLTETTDVLSVNVDGSTLEISADALRVKDAGITAAKISSGAAPDGQVLTANGTGGSAWETPAGGAPSGPAGGALDGTYPNPGLAASVAGAGLAEATNVLSVNTDNSTIEISGDALRVKSGGITSTQIASAYTALFPLLAPTASSRNVIQPTSASVVPLTLKGAASQSSNLLESQNSAGLVLMSVEKDGTTGVGIPLQTTFGAGTGTARLVFRSGVDLQYDRAQSFTISSVDTATEIITTAANHKMNTGVAGYFSGGTPPGGLSNNTIYYIIYVSANQVKMATTKTNAEAGTAINLTSSGAGTFQEIIPAGTETFRINKYGDVFFGGNSTAESPNWQNDTDYMKAGAAWLAHRTRLIVSGGFRLMDISDPPDFGIMSAGSGTGPNGPPKALSTGAVIGSFRFLAAASTTAGGTMTKWTAVSKAPAHINAEMRENAIDLGGDKYASGGALNFFTTPIGLTAGSASNQWGQKRLSIRPTGAIVAASFADAGGSFSEDDADSALFGKGDYVAQKKVWAGEGLGFWASASAPNLSGSAPDSSVQKGMFYLKNNGGTLELRFKFDNNGTTSDKLIVAQ